MGAKRLGRLLLGGRDFLAEVEQALADPEVRKKLVDLAQEIFPPEQQTPEALGKFQQAEIDKWWPIIKEVGIKVQ